MTTADRTSIADLVAKYGSSSATAWLEFGRYKLWSPSEPVPESAFTPVQGYMEKDPYIFAWGNPLVSSPAALPSVARQFADFCVAQGKRPVWACVDYELEEVLGSEGFGWSTVSCIYEDVVDPAHVLDLTSPESKGKEGQHVIKDLKKNLYRADKYGVHVEEVKKDSWTAEDKAQVEEGIRLWRESKSGLQIASTTLQPWLDEEHRRYWVARKDDQVIGILILTPIQDSSWQIKNAVSFPSAPKGTSEALIYTSLKDLHDEQEAAFQNGAIPAPNPTGAAFSDDTSSTSASDKSVSELSVTSDTSSDTSEGAPVVMTKGRRQSMTGHRDANRVTVTFGISASNTLAIGHNLGGWKVHALSKTYNKVAKGARLVQRGEFRSKFDSDHEPMYVCYPQDSFGLEGVNALLKVLKK